MKNASLAHTQLGPNATQSSKVTYEVLVSSAPPQLALPMPPGQIEDTLSHDLARAQAEMFGPSAAALPPPPPPQPQVCSQSIILN